MNPKSNNFFLRIWTYSLEMFPVFTYLPYVIALYVCMNFTTQAVLGTNIVIDINGIIGMLTAFFMMLLMRTFDDLKDIEIDKELFPDRATPRGAVLKSDIQVLSVFSFIVLVTVNILFARQTLLMFFIMMAYALLTFKWFFAEKIHRERVFLTMATHQPLPIMITLFLMHTALASGPVYEPFSWNLFILLLVYSLPITAWETSRKIRSADKETEYVTFSKLFGARKATLIPLTALILTSVFSAYTGFILNFHFSFFIIVILLLLYILFYYVRFIIKPIEQNNVLKNTAMIFTSLVFLSMLLFTLLNYRIINQL